MKTVSELHTALMSAQAALRRIAELEGAPDEDPSAGIENGLHCGVEDLDCQDRYQGATFGYTQGAGRVREWAAQEASFALGELNANLRESAH